MKEELGGKPGETEVCRWVNVSVRRRSERVSEAGGG